MNLKKSLIVSILVIALVCLLTVNVNAAEGTFSVLFYNGEGSSEDAPQIAGGVISTESTEFDLSRSGASLFKIDAEAAQGSSSQMPPQKDGYDLYFMSLYSTPNDFSANSVGTFNIVLPIPDTYSGAADMTYCGSPVSMTYNAGKISFTLENWDGMGDGTIYLKTGAASTVIPAGEGRTETVAEDVFAAAKENGTPVTVSVSSLATWNFPSVSNVMAFNPNLTASTTKMSKVQSSLIEEAEFIDFEHSGVLPGRATVTVNIGTARFGTESKSLWVYYYNPSNKGYEYVGRAAYANGSVTMELDHCSTYALMENELVLGGGGPAPEAAAPAPAVAGALDKEPKAGEMFILPVAILSVISLGVVAIINKK